jgi:quercetin dioxygenase-like cupin family protein
MFLLHVSRGANAHGSAGSGDHVARRRALLSLVLTVGSTRSDLPTAACRCRAHRPRPLESHMTASSHLDTQHLSHPVRLAELRQTARRFALNPNLAALLPDSSRERTWARLAGDARMDVWLISWPEGTETGWHDHGDAAGAFAVASGVVLAQTWALGTVQHRTLSEGDTRVFSREHVHNVVGVGPGRALTVHAYAPALVTMGRFELGPDGPVQLTGAQDASSW